MAKTSLFAVLLASPLAKSPKSFTESVYAMSKNSWVGFPEVTERTEGEITVGYTGMPQGMDPESLQLNVRALRRGVIGWGGYSALTLSAYDGDEDQLHIGMSQPDGSGVGAASGSAAVSKAESVRSQPETDTDLNANDIRNGQLGIQWNASALSGRLSLDQQYSPSKRANQLDRAVRSATMGAVFRHNTTQVCTDRDPKESLAYVAYDLGIYGLAAARFLEQNPDNAVAVLLAGVMIRKAVVPSIRHMVRGDGSLTFRDYISDPLTVAARPFRAGAGMSVLASSRLVRATPTKVQ